MRQAIFRFYAELNNFLPPERRRKAFPRVHLLTASIKYVIESLAVPHTEVGLILVNATPVEFTCLVQDGDRVSVLCPSDLCPKRIQGSMNALPFHEKAGWCQGIL
jgi:hypothetical protein